MYKTNTDIKRLWRSETHSRMP